MTCSLYASGADAARALALARERLVKLMRVANLKPGWRCILGQMEKQEAVMNIAWRVSLMVLVATGLTSVQGCVVATVVGATVGVAATVVETGVSVAGTAVKGAAKVGGVVIDAATSNSKE